MNTEDVAAARARIAAANRALVITHINPDGDAVGSLLGFGLALRAAGKEVVFACADPVPDLFGFLPSFKEITATPAGAFDLITALDISEASRMGAVGELIGRPPHLVFDHHVTNGGFGEVNLIDVSAASTAELVAEHLDALNLPLTQPVAECLLTGLVSDTLGFRTSNTSAKSLALAQRLIEAGAVLHTIYDHSLHRRSFAAVRLWAEGLTRIRLADRMVWTTLPLDARKASGFPGSGDADLINVLASVREADVAVIFVERPDGQVKVSWRSVPGVDVSALAVAFGGGGHAPAAGAEVPGTLAEVETKVLAATKAVLKGQGTRHKA
jgi:phosphoesterase RecJ-like protein